MSNEVVDTGKSREVNFQNYTQVHQSLNPFSLRVFLEGRHRRQDSRS